MLQIVTKCYKLPHMEQDCNFMQYRKQTKFGTSCSMEALTRSAKYVLEESSTTKGIYYLARGVIIWHQRESLFDKECYYIGGKNKTGESLFSAWLWLGIASLRESLFGVTPVPLLYNNLVWKEKDIYMGKWDVLNTK